MVLYLDLEPEYVGNFCLLFVYFSGEFGQKFYAQKEDPGMFFLGPIEKGNCFGIDKWKSHEMNVFFFLGGAMFDGEVAFREWGIRWI